MNFRRKFVKMFRRNQIQEKYDDKLNERKVQIA